MLGINDEDLDKINSQKEFIRAHLDSDPMVLALKGTDACICTQVKMLQKCKRKLPHYYEALCVIPPLSYEQSGSFQTAGAKAYSGKKLLDLTCGLGVDAERFSHSFNEVITIERDPLLAKIAETNFRLLGASNIQVINTDCTDFLKNYNGEQFDMVYCDPARRNEKKRTFLLSDCSPDIMAVINDIRRIGRRLVIKMSPLFDVKEIFRLFPGCCVEVISLEGECKEVLADVVFGEKYDETVICTVIDAAGNYSKYSFTPDDTGILTKGHAEKHKYLYIADVTFKKSGTAPQLMHKYFAEYNYEIYGPVILSDSLIENFPGRKYRITERMEYRPGKIKKIFKEKKITTATVIKGNSKVQPSELKRSSGLKDGPGILLVTVDIDEKPFIFLVEDFRA